MTVVEPGGRVPAPDPLRLLQLFVNTHDRLTDEEALRTPDDVTTWARRNGIGDVRVSPRQFLDLLRFREALRSILASHNGEPVDGALEVLNELCEGNELRITFSGEGRPVLTSESDGSGALIRAVLRAALASVADGAWDRLKACPACGWVFYDHSRNCSGKWCTMAICGVRAKMKAYRRRVSAGLSPSP